jgi:hypothetical protein
VVTKNKKMENRYRKRLRSYAPVRKGARARITKWVLHVRRTREKNTTDPITLYPPEPPVFKHVAVDGYVTAFGAVALLDYLRGSGCFEHPLTRVPFNDCELRRLQNLIPDGRDILAEKKNLEKRRQDSIATADLIAWLEQYIGSTVEQMLADAQYPNSITLRSTIIFFVMYAPRIRHGVAQLLQVTGGYEAVESALAHQLERVELSTRSNTYDVHVCGVISTILNDVRDVALDSLTNPDAAYQVMHWRNIRLLPDDGNISD